jgi:hypothetical protein
VSETLFGGADYLPRFDTIEEERLHPEATPPRRRGLTAEQLIAEIDRR